MLPTYPKKEPTPIALTVRLSKSAVQILKSLSAKHNMSQADIIDYLIKQAADKNTVTISYKKGEK